MTDIVETLKTQLKKGYELGDGNLCLVASRDLEVFITEIERLTALLREGIEVTMPYGDDGTVAYWRAKARRALENKP